ncbi:huntingtin-interacting protein 1-like isoform X2 [Lineus longissimus]|uniref:huntingtin-interacting protein 1-like isoform X2 n=1 Tax=Lineus longissimus TaxID=88925 RepID=UPI00315D36B5
MALPRVLSSRGKTQAEIEKETFERHQTTSIQKAISANEVPVKEKHVRSAIIGTFQENGGGMFWSVSNKLPLQGNPIICWKFLHVLHKLMRDGHKNVILDSQKYCSHLTDLGKLWGHLKDGYGKLIKLYTRLLVQKLTFHKKYPAIPGSLKLSDEELDEIVGRDINSHFEVSVDMLDYMDEILTLQAGVFGSLDMSRSNSMTATGQCRLAPLIPCIQDSALLYDYIVKLLFKLHASLPADTLAGHRDRFGQQFKSLKNFYYSSRNLQYFKNLLCVPSVPDNPPNFLVASELHRHERLEVVVPEAQPDPEPEVDSLIDTAEPPQPPIPDRFDSVFGGNMGNFNFTEKDPKLEEKDKLIEQLHREIERLKREINRMREDHMVTVQALREQIMNLETELESVKKLAQHAGEENNRLRSELEMKARNDEVAVQLQSVDKLAKANEEKFKKMKDIYGQLRQEHVSLIRTHAEVNKQLGSAKKVLEDKEQEKKRYSITNFPEELEGQLDLAKNEKKMVESMMQKSSDDTTNQLASTKALVMQLEQEKKDMEDKLQAIEKSKGALENSLQQTEEERKELEGLKQELDTLLHDTEEKLHDMELEHGNLKESYEQVQTQLKETQGSKTGIVKELECTKESLVALEAKLKELEKQKQDDIERLKTEHMDTQHKILVHAVEEAESILNDALEQFDNPGLIAVKCSADYLISRIDPTITSTEELRTACENFKAHPKQEGVIDDIVQKLSMFSYRAGDCIINGKATSHSAPIEKGDELASKCRKCGTDGLSLLGLIRQDAHDNIPAEVDEVLASLRQIHAMAEELRPKIQDVKPEELGDLVDQEMYSTQEAIDQAASRFQDMLESSRKDHSGIQLEVNERIIDSCTALMKAIKILVEKSKALQREIVAQGRGAADSKEFFKKHHRWTEGLISAAKAVGAGANHLLDSADKLVRGNGTFEEVIVSSQDIAASTTQLVVASRVKADPKSKSLADLTSASKGVTQATGNVVASAKAGASMIEEKDTMDFSQVSLTQAKRMEMNSQVRVLQLENDLEKERVKLAELRKKHYQLAGESEGWEVEDVEALDEYLQGKLLADEVKQRLGMPEAPQGQVPLQENSSQS